MISHLVTLLTSPPQSVLDLADNFVDHVLQTACRMAKARGSKVLEIRDIQLVLERQYNIAQILRSTRAIDFDPEPADKYP